MTYTRRKTDAQEQAVALIQDTPDSMGFALSQFYIRYFNLAVIAGYLLLAGDVAHGLLSYELILGLAGLYFVSNTTLMLCAIHGPGMAPKNAVFWMDCVVIMLGIAHDPSPALPVQLLLLESVVDRGMRSGFKAYRRGMLVGGLALAAGFGLRTFTVPGLQLPGVILALIMLALAFYMYVLLERSDQHLRKLIKLGQYDELTGLFNRRSLYDLARALCTQLEPGQRAVVMFADMDNLKTFNDEHGHAVGDAAIQTAGHAIDACLREKDLAARYGGDEFVAVFADVDIVEARRIAERLQASISDIELQANCLKLSLSIGLAEVTGPNANFEIGLQRADAALYRAKEKTGKGAITTAMHAS